MCLFDNTIYPLRKQVRNIELSVKKKKKKNEIAYNNKTIKQMYSWPVTPAHIYVYKNFEYL